MAVAHRSPRPDLSARPLLLVDVPAEPGGVVPVPPAGADGDPGVAVVDLTGATGPAPWPDTALTGPAASGRPFGARVADADVGVAAAGAGASLLVLEPAVPVTDALAAATRSGVVVVAPAAAVTALLAAGTPADLLVVEAVAGPGPVRLDPPAPGTASGVVLAPPVGGGPERRAGWEIGALTTALLQGARTVRGAHPGRFRRVLAVVEALRGPGEAEA